MAEIASIVVDDIGELIVVTPRTEEYYVQLRQKAAALTIAIDQEINNRQDEQTKWVSAIG